MQDILRFSGLLIPVIREEVSYWYENKYLAAQFAEEPKQVSTAKEHSLAAGFSLDVSISSARIFPVN
jgi:hypothetical protein